MAKYSSKRLRFVFTFSLLTVLSYAAVPLAAVAVTTTSAASSSTAPLFPRDSREFFYRSYAPDELSPDDAFCYKLATTCPYLSSRTARPTSSTNVRVRVRVDFRPTHFVGIDDLNHQFAVVGTFIFNWQLPRCARWMWTQDQYEAVTNRTAALALLTAGNISLANHTVATPAKQLPYNKNVTECRYRKSEIWHPSVRHLNAVAKPDVFESFGRDVVLTADARAHWEVSLRLDSACKLSFKAFPFDRQRCSITLGRYNYHDFIFQDELMDEDQSEEMFDTLLKNSIWQLDDLTTSIHAHNFSITFDVSRISESYAGTIFIPTTLLSILQLSTVMMPPEKTDRSAFSITGFVALAVFQSLFTSSIPRTSEILYITIYYEVQMAIGVGITIYSLLICRLLGRYKKLGLPCIYCFRSGFKLRIVDAIDLLVFIVSSLLFLAANYAFYKCGVNIC